MLSDRFLDALSEEDQRGRRNAYGFATMSVYIAPNGLKIASSVAHTVDRYERPVMFKKVSNIAMAHIIPTISFSRS